MTLYRHYLIHYCYEHQAQTCREQVINILHLFLSIQLTGNIKSSSHGTVVFNLFLSDKTPDDVIRIFLIYQSNTSQL